MYVIFHVCTLRDYHIHFKLHKEFLELDADGDGSISVEEVSNMIKTLKRKLKMSEKEITKFVKEIDQNGDGKVDVSEFVNMVEGGSKRDIICKALIQRAGMRKTFRKYDKDGNGEITRDEFRRIVEDKYQTTLMQSQVDSMMKQADVDKSGKIDYEEFLKAFSYFPVSH